MLNPLVATLAFESEMLIEYIFFSNISEKRWSSAHCLLIGLILYGFGVVVNLFSYNHIVINFVVTFFLIFLYSLSCFHINFWFCIFYCVILCALSVTSEGAVVLTTSAIIQGQPQDYNGAPMLAVFYILLSKTLYFITTLFLLRAHACFNKGRKIPLVVILYPFSTLISYIALHYVCVQEQISAHVQYLIALITGIMFIATLLIFLIHQKQTEKDEEFIRIQSEIKRLQLEKTYYNILDQQNQQLLMYAHDAKSHLSAIQSLTSNSVICEYVAKLSGQLESYTRTCHSGNMLLDVMVNKYVIECDQHGITFDYNVKLYNMTDIEDLDLVAILGNLMDNALEAAQKSSEKKIYLETTWRNSYHVLLIRNSSPPPQNANGRLITTKADRSLHGFGLKSVAKTLKKYQGDLQWDYDDASNTFTMTVMIGNPVNKDTIHI